MWPGFICFRIKFSDWVMQTNSNKFSNPIKYGKFIDRLIYYQLSKNNNFIEPVMETMNQVVSEIVPISYMLSSFV